MSTKGKKTPLVPESFDFINFQDELQPYLDALSVSCIALNQKANEHDDGNLNKIANSVEMQINQINELCEKYDSLFVK